MKISRNDPCPCGSGKKYKKCCLGRQQSPAQPDGVAETFAEVRQLLKGKDFDSLEEANAFLSTQMRQRNQAPQKDFDGLSSEQMHRFLHFPFESDGLVVFPERLGEEPTAPIMTLFGLLVEAIGEQGLKPTAKGNLPRNFCREAALSYWGEEVHRERTQYGNINKEEDFFDLRVTRLVAELAGLIRKYRGKFILSRDCRRLLDEQGMAGIFPRLLRTYAQKFNWAYRDGYPDLGFVQQSFLFILYLLHRHGNNWKPHTFYADSFLKAFPRVLDQVPAASYRTPEETVRSCYTHRALECFVGFFGLAEVEKISKERYSYNYRVKKLPLLDAAVCFRV
ncbi:MAG: SEC-C domain-containing protein [Chloroflexi bacterium]|nr:SEC-C domain-containing protein [Chloroflexota bacterium]